MCKRWPTNESRAIKWIWPTFIFTFLSISSDTQQKTKQLWWQKDEQKMVWRENEVIDQARLLSLSPPYLCLSQVQMNMTSLSTKGEARQSCVCSCCNWLILEFFRMGRNQRRKWPVFLKHVFNKTTLIFHTSTLTTLFNLVWLRIVSLYWDKVNLTSSKKNTSQKQHQASQMMCSPG